MNAWPHGVIVVPTVPTTARMHLLVDGRLASTQDVDLQVGVNRFVLAQEPLPAGQHLVRLQIEPALDTLAQNNSAGAVVVVSGPPAVLIAQGAAGDGQYLADALRAAGLKVDITTVGQTSLDPQTLRDYASVVLANVQASSLPPGQMLALQTYVRDFGGGLVVVGGDSAQQRKPHPAPLLEAARRLGVDVSQSLMVGDNIHDVEAAHAAGMRCVAVGYGYHHRPPSEFNADHLIDRFADLLPLVINLASQCRTTGCEVERISST